MKFSKLLLISSFILTSSSIITSCSTPKKQDTPPTPIVKSEDTSGNKTQESYSFKTIYFDFNKYNVRNDQKSSAMDTVKYLKENPKVEIQIQGNTDSRGSIEYNMALGLKRAQALKKFFKANGVQNSIETISFGKEKPAMPGNSEADWAKNRRDDIIKKK